MNEHTERTTVYSWPGPPRITVATQPVHRNGSQWLQHIVEGGEGGFGVVAVVTHDGKYLVVNHYRPVTGTSLVEFPRGFGRAPRHGLTVEQQACEDAEREVLEETGITTQNATFLGFIWPDSGLLGTKVAVVHVQAASHTPRAEQDGEIEQARWITKAELAQAIKDVGVCDGITLAAYAVWTARAV